MWTELHTQNFEILSIAEESKGPEAAQPWIDAGNPQYPVLLDTAHVVAELYHTRNVPAGIWIDEQGRIVRPPEVCYAQTRRQGQEPVLNEKYINALRHWVKNGAESIYVLKPGEVAERTHQPTAEDAEATAYFRLGVWMYDQGRGEEAIPYFKHAQELRPQNWNFKRQAWNLGDAERDYGTNFRASVEQFGPAYDPVDMPDLPAGG